MESAKITPLCEIGAKYGTDKTPLIKHAYTPFYYNLFKDRKDTIKKVLELGIGHYKDMQIKSTIYDPGLKRNYHRGASLYMWREFFPNAQIYGADRVIETMFADERITTFICDERKKKDLEELIKKTGSDIDIFIDDASHRVEHQIFTAQTVLPLLNPSAIYVIEDVTHTQKIKAALNNYNGYVPEITRTQYGGMLYVINK